MPVMPQVVSSDAALVGAAWAPFVIDDAGLEQARQQFSRFGLAVFGPAALSRETLRRLRAEAGRQRHAASWALRYGDGRSRVPESNLRGHFGPVARRFLKQDSVARLMRKVTGQAVAPSWSASCYTWYDVPGAWLGRHCDKQEACSLTMLVGLESEWPAGSEPPPGNQLWIYDSFEPKPPLFRVTTLTNRIAILDGKRWPHERQPVQNGQRVSVLCACFRAAAA
jgi:hypothetical protein